MLRYTTLCCRQFNCFVKVLGIVLSAVLCHGRLLWSGWDLILRGCAGVELDRGESVWIGFVGSGSGLDRVELGLVGERSGFEDVDFLDFRRNAGKGAVLCGAKKSSSGRAAARGGVPYVVGEVEGKEGLARVGGFRTDPLPGLV